MVFTVILAAFFVYHPAILTNYNSVSFHIPWQISDSFAHHRLPTSYALPQHCRSWCACGCQVTEYAQGPDFWNKRWELSSSILGQTDAYMLFRMVCISSPSLVLSWAHQSTSEFCLKILSRWAWSLYRDALETLLLYIWRAWNLYTLNVAIWIVWGICQLLHVQSRFFRTIFFSRYYNSR
jgi:hypothetical protein